MGNAASNFPVMIAVLDYYQWIGPGGAIAIDATRELLEGCSTWNDLAVHYAGLLEQIHFKATNHVPVVAFSFGCRIAFAAVAAMQDRGPAVCLMLIDGPVGGPLGSFERVLLEATQSADAAATTETRLVKLLAAAKEETPAVMQDRHSVVFVASGDEVGVEEFKAAFPEVPIKRVAGKHLEIMFSPRTTYAVCGLLVDAYETVCDPEGRNRSYFQVGLKATTATAALVVDTAAGAAGAVSGQLLNLVSSVPIPDQSVSDYVTSPLASVWSSVPEPSTSGTLLEEAFAYKAYGPSPSSHEAYTPEAYTPSPFEALLEESDADDRPTSSASLSQEAKAILDGVLEEAEVPLAW